MTKKDRYSNIIDVFDKIDLSNEANRRMSSKPLYDYFQMLLREVGVKRCGLNENSIKNAHINVRWINVRSCLECIEDPSIWDDLIKIMDKIRSRVEHNDDYNPTESDLKFIRNKIPEFTLWIMRASDNYLKITSNFTFKESFYHNLNLNISKAEIIIREYCDDSKDIQNDLNDYCHQLTELIKDSRIILEKIEHLEDINRSDLGNLIQLIKIITIFDTREEILLDYMICPKCGGNIKETNKNLNHGTYEDTEPYGIYYRVGCQKCDYTIHDEIFDL